MSPFVIPLEAASSSTVKPRARRRVVRVTLNGWGTGRGIALLSFVSIYQGCRRPLFRDIEEEKVQQRKYRTLRASQENQPGGARTGEKSPSLQRHAESRGEGCHLMTEAGAAAMQARVLE